MSRLEVVAEIEEAIKPPRVKLGDELADKLRDEIVDARITLSALFDCLMGVEG